MNQLRRASLVYLLAFVAFYDVVTERDLLEEPLADPEVDLEQGQSEFRDK